MLFVGCLPEVLVADIGKDGTLPSCTNIPEGMVECPREAVTNGDFVYDCGVPAQILTLYRSTICFLAGLLVGTDRLNVLQDLAAEGMPIARSRNARHSD
mgnify:CR=1 FL=1